MGPPDDLPAGVHAVPAAAECALSAERRQEERPFEEIIRAVEAGLCKSALPYALWLLKGSDLASTYDAEDAVSAALVRTLKNYNPSRGAVKPYFDKALRSVCVDMLRASSREPLTSVDPEWLDERPQAEEISGFAAVENKDMRDKITAALAVLDLSPTERVMLDIALDLLDGAIADRFDHLSGEQRKREMAAFRQQKKRALDPALDTVLREAGLTAEEIKAVELVRTRKSLAADGAAAPELDVGGLSKSAKRKVLRLFNIDIGDSDDGHA